MFSVLKAAFIKQYNKALLFLISFIGLNSASGSDKIIQPEYGVRIVPDYGPPANRFDNFFNYCIIGKVKTSKNKPLKETRIDAYISDSLAGTAYTDEKGFYKLNLKFYGDEGKIVTLNAIDSNSTDGIEYAEKRITVNISFQSKLLTTVVDFTLYEKRKKSRKN